MEASASASAPESIDFTTITPQDILKMVGDDLPEDQMIIDELNNKIAEFVAAGTLPEDFSIETIKMTVGGRRHRGSKKAHKKSRKGNKMLSSWVAFVKKVQHEEKISYSDAMKRASARKKEWKRGQMDGGTVSTGTPGGIPTYTQGPGDPGYQGGRRTKRRGSRKMGQMGGMGWITSGNITQQTPYLHPNKPSGGGRRTKRRGSRKRR